MYPPLASILLIAFQHLSTLPSVNTADLRFARPGNVMGTLNVRTAVRLVVTTTVEPNDYAVETNDWFGQAMHDQLRQQRPAQRVPEEERKPGSATFNIPAATIAPIQKSEEQIQTYQVHSDDRFQLQRLTTAPKSDHRETTSEPDSHENKSMDSSGNLIDDDEFAENDDHFETSSSDYESISPRCFIVEESKQPARWIQFSWSNNSVCLSATGFLIFAILVIVFIVVSMIIFVKFECRKAG